MIFINLISSRKDLFHNSICGWEIFWDPVWAYFLGVWSVLCSSKFGIIMNGSHTWLMIASFCCKQVECLVYIHQLVLCFGFVVPSYWSNMSHAWKLMDMEVCPNKLNAFICSIIYQFNTLNVRNFFPTVY